MFQKIFIKSKEHKDGRLNVSYLIDTMLFYGKVIILVHNEELKILIRELGPSLLEELVNSGRIELKIRMNMFSSQTFPFEDGNIGVNIDILQPVHETHEGMLYSAHREIVNNSSTNLAFAKKFSKLSTPLEFESEITDKIKEDFESKELIKKTLPIYFNDLVPEFIPPNDINLEINPTKNFGPFKAYSFESDIGLDKINELYKKQIGEEIFHPLDYSGFLLALAEAQGDIYITSKFESEIVTRDIHSKLIEAQFKHIIQKRLQSQENLDLFDEYVLANCHSIGFAFTNNIISSGELLELFEKADKFRHWLDKVPEDKNLIGEYYKASTEKSVLDKLPTKTTRFMIFEGVGIIADLAGLGGAGTAAATALSALDNFYLDKIIDRKWRPNHYVDGELKPKIER